MRIRSRMASIIFKCLIVCMGTYALLDQLGLFAGVFKVSFFYYFTDLSNVAVVVYFICAIVHLIRHRDSDAVWAPQFKYAAMMGVTITCLVAHFLLGGGLIMPDGTFSFAVLFLHYLVPIASVLDWLLFDEKGCMKLAAPLVWMAFPLAYLAYALTMVGVLGVDMGPIAGSRYPYPFIDVDANGAGTVAITVVVLIAGFVVLGYIFLGIDRLLARIGKGLHAPS